MTDTAQTAKGSQGPVFWVIVVLFVYLSYLVLSPFLTALTWAMILAILFRGMQAWLAPRIGPNRGALVTTLVALFLIVAPTILLISAVAREVPQAKAYVQNTSRNVPRQLDQVWQTLRSKSPVALPEDPSELLVEGGRRAAAFLAPRAGAAVAGVFGMLGTLLSVLFALYFLVRDGESMSVRLRDHLPLSREDSERLIGEARDLVVASVGAGVAVAAAQGFIGGLAFWILGLGAPVLWGVVTAFASLLPVVGATLVWVPAGIGLLLTGQIGRGIAMLLIGALGISGVDNVLRPALLSGRTSIGGLVVFFGLLGGTAAFGLVGIVIGPIVLALTGSVLEILRRPDAGTGS